MKYWLGTFKTTAGEPVYKRLEEPNKSKALISALELASDIPNIDENTLPKIVVFKDKHLALLEVSSDHEEGTNNNIDLQLAESLQRDTTREATWNDEIQMADDVFGFLSPDNNEDTDITVAASMSENFLTDTHTPIPINRSTADKVVSLIEAPGLLPIVTKKDEAKQQKIAIDKKTEKPKKAKKEPINYLKLPKSKEYSFFPERLDYVINEPVLINPKIQQAIDDINQKINRLFPGEVLRLEGVPDAVYHATQGIGSTKLKKFAEAPAKYKANIQLKSKSMDMGSAVHIRVLQPEIFNTTIACKPPWLSRNSNEYKDIAAAFPDVTFLNECDYNAAIECSDALLKRYEKFFSNGAAEISYWKRDEITQLIIKARIDYEHENLCVDLKTTITAAPGEFDRQASKYGYFLQDALYSMVTGIDNFAFIATETSESYLSTLNMFNQIDRGLAKDYCNELLHRLSLCYKNDVWPGYTPADEITQMDLTYFARQQIENF